MALPEGEDRVNPRASKLAYHPLLTNAGCRSRYGAASTAAAEEGDEEAPRHGGGGLATGNEAPDTRLSNTLRTHAYGHGHHQVSMLP